MVFYIWFFGKAIFGTFCSSTGTYKARAYCVRDKGSVVMNKLPVTVTWNERFYCVSVYNKVYVNALGIVSADCGLCSS
jgi:hypothetical protein